MAIEKFSTLLPRNGQGKRIMKSKLLTALGATGVLLPFPQNPEHILERKILLQNAFNATGSGGGGGGPPGNRLLVGLVSYWKMYEAANTTRVDSFGANNLADHVPSVPQTAGGTTILGRLAAGPCAQAAGSGLQAASTTAFSPGIGNSFTISGWSNCGLTLNSNFFSVDSGAADGNFAFGLFDPNVGVGPCLVYFNDNGVQTNISTFTLPNDGNMHLITVGYDASTKLGFISSDAGARTTVALTTGIKASTAKLTFFNDTNFGNPNTNPSIDQDWGYWNRALSLTDVTTLYNGGMGIPFESFTLT